jgi:hypothetical protein
MSFKINRKESGSQYIRTPGIWAGKIVFPSEIDCTPKGDTRVRLEYVTVNGERVTDDYINKESVWWRINVLIAAIDPDGKKFGADGVELDFTKDQNFITFLRALDGIDIKFATWTETYKKGDGSEGTAVRVKPLDPKRGRKQIAPAALAQIEAAEKAAEGPDEVPF